MKNTRTTLLVLPKKWRGSINSAAAVARRFDANVLLKSLAATFEAIEPVVIVGADEVLTRMLRAHNRVERVQ